MISISTILYAANSRAKTPLLLSINSALRHIEREDIEIVILTGYFGADPLNIGLTGQDKSDLGAVAEHYGKRLRFIDCTSLYREKLSGRNDSNAFSKFAMLRLLTPYVLPDSGGVLYMDVDTLVLRDISFLWDTIFEDDDVYSMPPTQCELYCCYNDEHHIKNIGVYCNSGVLVVNSTVSPERLSRYDRACKLCRVIALEMPDLQAINKTLRLNDRAFGDIGLDIADGRGIYNMTGNTHILHYQELRIDKYDRTGAGISLNPFYNSMNPAIRDECLALRAMGESVGLNIFIGT